MINILEKMSSEEKNGGVAPIVAMGLQAGMTYATSRQQGQQGQRGEQSLSSQALKSWDDATRRDQLVIRGPPPKEAVSMVRYIVIAVLIMVVLLIYYGIGRKPQEAPKYQSVFGFTPGRLGLPAMPAERLEVPNTDATRVFGIVPRKPITNRVI